jgi:hypothetical protein
MVVLPVVCTKRIFVARVYRMCLTTTRMEENDIEVLHRSACELKQSTYIDPATGYKVFTAFAHEKRGKCCGNKCRHCPFNHINVPSNEAK